LMADGLTQTAACRLSGVDHWTLKARA
jgi:hypothetical protein